MRRLVTACIGLLALVALPEAAAAAGLVHRYLLVAGANYGGADRPRLRYAVTDAERFGRVLVELGGVTPANEIVLKEPKLRDFLQALDALTARVAEGQRAAAGNGGGRSEILVYYSGHADEKGLLLGEDRYSYRSLRERLDQIPADVRIAVLDACASGAFVRIKGGKTRPAFLVDQSSAVRGHAFLTSSSETEAAQESDRIAASYFTHYLVSGLRGAADVSGDGKVTLNEAYQFAFNETVGRTTATRGGAQHPWYDIKMTGTGDVVMTDVRQTSAILVLGEEMAGRFFIHDSAQQLVVELYKPAGRKVELGLEPGTYDVRLERDGGWLLGKTQVAEGGRVALDAALFHVTAPEPTWKRGAQSTQVKVGFKGGLSLANITFAGPHWPSPAHRTGFAVGAFAVFPVAPRLAVQPEVLVATRGYDLPRATTWATMYFTYLDVPVMLRADVHRVRSTTIYGYGGPNLGFLLNARTRAVGSVPEHALTGMRSIEMGAAAGGGVRRGRILVELRYLHGFTNVWNLTSYPGMTITNHAFKVLGGLMF